MSDRTEHEPLVFAPSESRSLGLAASESSGIALGLLEEREYESGEFKLRPLQPVRDRAVFVVQSLVHTREASSAQRLLRLLFLLQTLRDAGSGRTVAVIPYLAYARKDRRTKPRDPVYTRYIAQLLEAAGAERIVALDVHNASALDNAFRIPVDHLSALPMMAAYFNGNLPPGKLAVASPDIGGIKRAQMFQEMLQRTSGRDVDLVFVEKRRKSGVVSSGMVVGEVGGRAVIVLDDLCATGTTLIAAAAALRSAGATSVHVAVTHAPMKAGIATVAAANDIARVIVTDSVGHSPDEGSPERSSKLVVLQCGELFGRAIARIARGESLAPLAEHWAPIP